LHDNNTSRSLIELMEFIIDQLSCVWDNRALRTYHCQTQPYLIYTYVYGLFTAPCSLRRGFKSHCGGGCRSFGTEVPCRSRRGT
jgi:hypothetical protein